MKRLITINAAKKIFTQLNVSNVTFSIAKMKAVTAITHNKTAYNII